MSDCPHRNDQYIGAETVRETYATSWFEWDDDGYPNEVFGDRAYHWDKPYRVCLDCGAVLSHDGWSWYVDDQAPTWVKRSAAQVMKDKGGQSVG